MAHGDLPKLGRRFCRDAPVRAFLGGPLMLILRSRRLVSCHMSHRHGLAGSMSRFLRGTEYLSGRRVSAKAAERA